MHGQEPAAGKLYGPYDRDELDTQYNNRARVSDYMTYFEKWKEWSAATRAKHACRLNLAYGSGENETLDFFPADRSNAPVNLFIHGGYRQSLDKGDFSFVSEGMFGNGVASAVINYGLCPKVTMNEITRQNRAAKDRSWRKPGPSCSVPLDCVPTSADGIAMSTTVNHADLHHRRLDCHHANRHSVPVGYSNAIISRLKGTPSEGGASISRADRWPA